MCQSTVMSVWSSRPDSSEDREAASFSHSWLHVLLGWQMKETGSGKGILKEDDWLA